MNSCVLMAYFSPEQLGCRLPAMKIVHFTEGAVMTAMSEVCNLILWVTSPEICNSAQVGSGTISQANH